MKMRIIFVLLFVMTVSVHGSILIMDEFTIDFTDPNSVSENGIVWTPQGKVKRTEKGLLFSYPQDTASVDFGLLTKPYAIGLSWRPTHGVNLGVELSPLGKEKKYSGGTLHPSFYTIYVRYSPDLKNWSSWHVLQDKHKDWQERKKEGKYKYDIRLQIPSKERKKYNDYFSQYRKLDVPWTCDEEAMVKWIVQKEPKFFKEQIPFIGYIQFLCETSIRANQPLSEMKINIGWGVSGLHSPPKDGSSYKNRDNSPWRYKAPDKKNSSTKKQISDKK